VLIHRYLECYKAIVCKLELWITGVMEEK